MLAIVFGLAVHASWARWGHVRTDTGGSLDRAARIASGEQLYRDVLSPYGPLPDHVVAAAFRLFGIHLDVAYALGLLVVVAESLAIWTIVARVLTPGGTAVAVAAYWVFFAFNPGLFNWVLPNTFASTFGALFATWALALGLAAADRGRTGTAVAASLAVAAAGLSRIEFGAAAFAAALLPILAASPRGARRRLLVALVVPGLAVTAAIAGALVAVVPWRELVFDNLWRDRSLRVSVPALLDQVPAFGAPLRAAALRFGGEMAVRTACVALGLTWMLDLSGPRRIVGTLLVLAALAVPLAPGYPMPVDFTIYSGAVGFTWSPVAWGCLLPLTLVATLRGNRRAAPALLGMATLSLALALRWRLGLLWTSYYGFLAPVLVLLLAERLGAVLLAIVPRPRPTARRLALAAALVVGIGVGTAAQDRRGFYRGLTFPLTAPRGTIHTSATEGAPLAATIARVREHSRPDDWVAVLPEERLINFLAERRHPTRDPGVGPGWLATMVDIRRFLAEMEAREPRLIVLSTRNYPEFGAGALRFYARPIARWIDARYRLAWRSPHGPVHYRVYERRAGDRGHVSLSEASR